MIEGSFEQSNKPLIALLQLESDARRSADLLSLQYFIVNETRRVIRYRHAILFSITGSSVVHAKAVRASGTTIIDRTAPKIHWMEQVVRYRIEHPSIEQSFTISPEQLSDELRQDWQQLSLPYPVLVPLELPDGTRIGVFWLERESLWEDDELHLLQRLAATYAHAWGYFSQTQRRFFSRLFAQKTGWQAVIVIAILLCIPVRNSTLGPVKVVAKDPTVISAPMDGIIAAIPVEPNDVIDKDQLLLSYEDTKYRNEYVIAEQVLAVAQAELRRATQGAFGDAKNNAEVALLKAKVELAVIKRNFAKEMLDHVNVVAGKAGLLLLNDKAGLIGKPVTTGERLMEVADTANVKLLIHLPVENNIEFQRGAMAKIYWDVNPLQSIEARVTYASYRAEETGPGDLLAYRIEAEPIEPVSHLRIGWQGTAKIYGDDVSLFFYLFRRPLSALRQYIGF